MSRPNSARLFLIRLMVLVGAVGCGGTPDEPAKPLSVDPSTFKPVTGRITMKGKPTAKLVVALFSPSGVSSAGETDEDGRYAIQTMGSDGAPPGDYKIALSYFLAPDGSAQGLGARSAMVQSSAMRAAKETLPPKYADINKSELKTTVTSAGGTFDFDVDADPKPPVADSKPEADKSKESKPETDKPKEQETKKSTSK